MGKFSRLGNDLYSGTKSVDFVSRKWTWYAVSFLIVVAASAGLFVKGVNFGIEFVGGAEYRVALSSEQVNQDTVDDLRAAVADLGIPDADEPIVTTSGDSSILVQTEPLDDQESETVAEAILTTVDGEPTDLSVSELGPSWGEQVAQRSLIGLLVFLVLVVLFIWAYFRQWKMSIAALVALAHDMVITAGVYAWSGFEVSPATVTALLTILGFSLYDTVVVFDKVRENTKDLRAVHQTYAEAANLAVNQTLVRSLNTSIVALIPVGAILWVGGVQLGSGALKDLALALFVGMAAGLYSSVFIATPLLAHLKSTEDEVKAAEKREKARRRAAVDPYAAVPSFTDDMPIQDPDSVPVGSEVRPTPAPPAPPATRSEASGKGRVPPRKRGPVQQSSASGRSQPSRQSKSKRDKK